MDSLPVYEAPWPRFLGAFLGAVTGAFLGSFVGLMLYLWLSEKWHQWRLKAPDAGRQ